MTLNFNNHSDRQVIEFLGRKLISISPKRVWIILRKNERLLIGKR